MWSKASWERKTDSKQGLTMHRQTDKKLKGRDRVLHVSRRLLSAPPGTVSVGLENDLLPGEEGPRQVASGTHRGVVEAIAVGQPWLRGQAGAGEGAEQAGLELKGFAAATATTSGGWGVRQGALSWAAASPSASPAPGLLTRQVAGREQAVEVQVGIQGDPEVLRGLPQQRDLWWEGQVLEGPWQGGPCRAGGWSDAGCRVGPYPRGCWQRPAVFLEASEASASKPHRGRGWSELGCWGTQAHGVPVTPRGAKQWRQQGWWLPAPGRQLWGQAPSYREKEGISSPATRDPTPKVPRASAWTRAGLGEGTMRQTLSTAL